MYAVHVYIPVTAYEAVTHAMFQAGAGRVGHYDHCCWSVKGTGQFRPLKGAHPTLGSVGVVETVEEIKVEMICEQAVLTAVIAALKAAHPYETPAYDVWKLETI